MEAYACAKPIPPATTTTKPKESYTSTTTTSVPSARNPPEKTSKIRTTTRATTTTLPTSKLTPAMTTQPPEDGELDYEGSITDYLSDLSLEKKQKLGTQAEGVILDCQFEGSSCYMW